MASQYQARLDALVAVIGNLLQNNALVSIMTMSNGSNGSPFLTFSVTAISVSQLYDFYESNHFQYASGFISEGHWQGVLRGMDSELSAFHMTEYWARHRLIYRASFAEIVDTLIAKRRYIDCKKTYRKTFR